MDPIFDPRDFRIPDGVVHVCAAGETPFLRRHDAALQRYASDKSDGMRGRDAQEAEVERARALVAEAWGVDVADIGFVSSVAEGVSMLFESLPWQDGDNVCFGRNEYASVAAPFLLGKPPEARLADSADADAMAALVDARTRVIAVTYVSSLDGSRVDLQALRALADRVGAMLVVDFTQAAGYLPIAAGLADFAFSSCYKWLLGMTGLAVACWNRARQPGWAPGTAGWHSLASEKRLDYAAALALRPDALRFTRGNPAHGPVYVLASALDYLRPHEVGQVQAHVQALTTGLLERLGTLGIASSTPADPARHGGSVCIEHKRAQAIVHGMNRRGVYAWNGFGRIRFSFHGFNSSAELDRIEAALMAEWGA